jgi:hypothetical protein
MTTTIRTGSSGEYLGDRYERLRSCGEQLASDPGMVECDSIFGADGLRAFIGSVIDARLLDGLSDHDANTVALLITLDFPRGPERMAWRITDWLNEDGRSVDRKDDNIEAVAAVLALALALVLSAFAGPEFEENSAVVEMFKTPEKR